MLDEFKYDCFLSHTSKDKAVVRGIAERLRSDGLRVWFDEWEIKPGDSIPSKIEDGLETSRVLVLCMSASAFCSDWANMESQAFRFRDPMNKQRRFIPVLLDEAPIKGSLVQFRHISWLSGGQLAEYTALLDSCRPHPSLTPPPFMPTELRQPLLTEINEAPSKRMDIESELMGKAFETFQHVHDYRITLDKSMLQSLPMEIRQMFLLACKYEFRFEQDVIHAAEAYKLAAESALACIRAGEPGERNSTSRTFAELNDAEGKAVANMVSSYHSLSDCVRKHAHN